EVREEIRIENDAVFDDFRKAAAVVAVGQGVKSRDVDPDADRLMENADHVLGVRMVDGYLAADRAIDHGQERGRNHEEGQAARIGGGNEAGQVANDAAANGDDERLAVGGQINQAIVKLGGDGEGFLSFTGWADSRGRAKAG